MRRAGGVVGRLLQLLGLNSVPVAGFFGAGWSPGTALAVYWVEGLFVILFVSVRIVLHRRFTRKAGHYSAASVRRHGEAVAPKSTRSGSLLSAYLLVIIPFTLVHGLFLALLLFLFLPQEFGAGAGIAPADLRQGTVGVFVFLALGLAIDLVSLRERSFRSLELGVERAMGRILIVHLTILLGMAAVAYFDAPAAFFGVFAGLKLLGDLGGAFPHRELELEPPRWLRFLDRIKRPDRESFSEHWRRTELRERAIREANERPIEEAEAGRRAPP